MCCRDKSHGAQRYVSGKPKGARYGVKPVVSRKKRAAGEAAAPIKAYKRQDSAKKEHAVTMQGSCHCGTVRLTVPGKPEEVVACHCSLCSRRGMLWAYYPEPEVAVDGYTEAYVWGDRTICFNHCPNCGCTTHWSCLNGDRGRMGVNARLLDGFEPGGEEIQSLYCFGGEPVGVKVLEDANG